MTPTETNLRKELGLEIPGCGCKNYSVKAGAGGGKTTLLSRRIANQIIQGTPIEKFVIITYTNAAAAELREKITNRLQEIINSGVLKDEELKYAKEALNSIELMQISTIHAFLFKILREYAFETEIVMDARMLEEVEDATRKKNFFDKWYHEHFDEIEAFRDDWIHVSSKGNKSEHHREVFENMFNAVANVREKVIFDVNDHRALIDANADSYVRKWLPELLVLRNAISNNLVKPDKKARKLNKEADIVYTSINTVESASTYGADEGVKISSAIKNVIAIHNGKNVYSRCTEIFVDIDSSVEAICNKCNGFDLEWDFEKYYQMAMNAHKASKVAEYVCKMQKAYQKQIDEETLVLSNDDILYRAEKLLLEHSDVLEKLRDRYSKIYVDEFQDTTDLQTRIIKLLAEKKGTDLLQNDLEADKLLVVGDSKQSIYRFTGAEKAVYDDVDRLMDSIPDTVAESVMLGSNFRSNSDIVDWVNKSFDGSATGTINGLMADYTAMSTDWVVKEANALHGVYKYGDFENTCTRDEDVINVVNLVENLVNKPQYFLERTSRTEDGGVALPVLYEIQYSDIMIICKNTTHMDSYVKAFSAKGIPVNVQGKFKIDGDEVLRNFVLVLEYFAGYKNKKSRIAAVQILRGIDISKVDDSVISDAENELHNLRKQFRKEGLDTAGIVQRLLSHEEYFIPKGKTYTIENVRSYRIRLHQMTESCLGKNTGDLSELVRIMKEYLDTDVKREIPLESNENAIRLMNAHQSKGLTGQIVIIADRSADEKCRYGSFRKAGNYYPAATFKYNNYGEARSVTVPAYGHDMAMLGQVYKDETEEAVRLQYVAATRAAHALIIMQRSSSINTPWFTEWAYELDAKPDILEWIEGRSKDTASYTVVANKQSTAHTVMRLDDLASNLAAASIDKLSENQIVSITPSGLEPAGVTGYDVTDDRYLKEDRPSGNVLGTVMHRTYELIFSRYETISTLTLADQEKAVERIINQSILEQIGEMRQTDDSQAFMDFLRPIMMDYLSRVILPIISEADELYPEYTFSFYVSDSERTEFVKDFDKFFKLAKNKIEPENEKIWINGQADLVVKKKDGSIKVYDYKSDAMNGKPLVDFEKSLLDKYEGQLALYKYAIGKAFGVSEVETELIHLYK